MKSKVILTTILMVAVINITTFALIKGDNLVSPQALIWITGFFSGAIATRGLIELMMISNNGEN